MPSTGDLKALRKGDWLQTFTGRQFWPMDPRDEEVCVEDIAHALSMLCRYSGHCLRFYSVAEHSVLLSRAVSPENALWALLHDASEAYLVDVPRPIKPFLAGYGLAEFKVMSRICARFGLKGYIPNEVKAADKAIFKDECLQNMASGPILEKLDGTTLGVELQFWSPDRAEAEFLSAFNSLTKETPDAP